MSIALLVTHLAGVALLFVMISIELVAMCGAPRATTVETLRASVFAARASEKLAMASTVLIVGSGIWMSPASRRSTSATAGSSCP